MIALVFFVLSAVAAEPPTFDAALQQILTRSTAISQAHSQADYLHASDLPLKWGWTPTVSAIGARHNGTQEFSNTIYTDTSLRGEIDAKLNLFRFGADWAGVKKASADDRKNEADIENAWLKMEDTGVQTLVTWLQARKRVHVLESFVDLQKRSLDIAEQRYARGLLARQEVDKTQLDLQNTRARLSDAQTQAADASANLESLLGEREIRDEWPWSKSLLDAGFAAQFLRSGATIDRRPDLRSAQAQLEADDQLLQRTRRQLMPTLDAGYTTGITLPYDGAYNSFTTSEWSVTLSVPLWNQLSDYSAMRAQSARREGSEAELLRVRRDSNADLRASTERLRVLVESNRDQQMSLGIAQRLLDDGLSRFKQGRESTNDLTIDETRLLDTQLLSVQSWANTHLAISRYCHAIGERIPDCLRESL